MLTTALNYLPVIEEEVCSKKLSQTQSQKSAEGGEPLPEDESSGSSEDLFNFPCAVTIPVIETSGNVYRHGNDRFYPPLSQDCDTPPRLAA